MLVIRLAGPLMLVALCGPNPPLTDVIKSAMTYWGSHYLTLDAIISASECSIPQSIHNVLDKSILGYDI